MTRRVLVLLFIFLAAWVPMRAAQPCIGCGKIDRWVPGGSIFASGEVPTPLPWTGDLLPAARTPVATPTPSPVSKPVPVQAAVQVQGTRNTDSSNPYVDPWGCEARHAQQWSPSRKYWGKYQFDRSTWASHGGNPNEYGSASEAEQDRVAANVKYDAWPNC